MRTERPEIELLTDNPIETIEQDKFERAGFVNAIAEIIHSQSTKVNEANDGDYKKIDENLIIGIFGEWGFGKTSIINMLDENLQKRKLLTTYFNPWMYGSEDQILKSLFNVIIEKCGLQKEEKKQLVALLKQYYPLVSVMSETAGKVTNATLNIIGETEKTDATALKREIDKLLLGTANPLTIYIDDVDRLNKSEVQVLFKTLRLIASFKHVIYVISCDFEMVAKSIKENYADGLVQDGRSFIDKIIQIPIRIPEIRPDLLLSYGLDYIKKTVNIDLTDNTLFKSLFNQYLTSPRDVKRFVNSFRFTYNFIGESIIDADDLITMELIKAKAPIQFDFIKLYYISLKNDNPIEQYKRLRKEYFVKNKLDFSTSKKELSNQFIIVLLASEIFVNLFGISWISFNYIGSNGTHYAHLPSWEENIEEKDKTSLRNPEFFRQYMELNVNQEN